MNHQTETPKTWLQEVIDDIKQPFAELDRFLFCDDPPVPEQAEADSGRAALSFPGYEPFCSSIVAESASDGEEELATLESPEEETEEVIAAAEASAESEPDGEPDSDPTHSSPSEASTHRPTPGAGPATARPPTEYGVSKPCAACRRPPPPAKAITAELMAEILSSPGGVTKAEALAALKARGFAKTAAYAALSSNGRFAGHLQDLPGGKMTWRQKCANQASERELSHSTPSNQS